MYVDNKKVKLKRIANRIYEMSPGTTNDDQKQLLQMQLINTFDKKIFFPLNVNKKKLREQDIYLIWLDAGQLKISKGQSK